KESEGGIDCNAPDLGIDWQIPAEDRILSEKDKLHPLFKDFETCF
ncbi:MAG TPA: dTDP-4-dehydrorhamnose 3,5-epimerase, partial [Alphaproteobacteria bacterium]|nr:dTDP-4-dehydrorhamnose 3,5-epimerase [Alphaproteobacteria bacterium]